MAAKKMGVLQWYNEVVFFVTGQIGMKFGKKRQSVFCIEP